jgi:hypothetical protein
MDKGLEEQLERVRKLSERVAEIHQQIAQNTELLNRDRERAIGSPLHQLRDLRHHSNGSEAPEAATDRAPRKRRR